MIREFDLIARIAQRFATPEGVTFGIGDDCAVLDPGRYDLVTSDAMVESVHFRRSFCGFDDVGWKAVARCLSDIAAMGGGPGAFFLNLMLPQHDIDIGDIELLLDGIQLACDALVPPSFAVSLGGGDTTSSPGPLVVSITMLGEASPAGPVMRSGAVPGDRIVMLGPTGLAAAGLRLLEGHYDGASEDDFPAALQAYRRPRPRVHAGALLGLYGVPSALIDLSDGLGADLSHILSRSQVGAQIETYNVPRHPELLLLEERFEVDLLELMISGGDDYELLFTVPPARMPKLWELSRRYGWEVYDIGEVRAAEEGLRFNGADGQPLHIANLGYEHFSATASS